MRLVLQFDDKKFFFRWNFSLLMMTFCLVGGAP